MRAAPATTTVDTFVQAILRSGLLRAADIDEALHALPAGGRKDAAQLAKQLLTLGKLSSFQAQKLLKGAALGLVLGPFQVIAPIGRGGTGIVYLGRDTRNHQLVALKVLPPKKAREEERLLARFRREMELSQRVAHPHLAATVEVGEFHGAYFLAMEYIPGKNLYRLVRELGPLPVQRAARLFAEVADALIHAHGRGLIHRDLKPSNIMIMPNDHAKVLDLGFAMVEGEVALDRAVVGGRGYVLGSMDYIAPEQTADASAVDGRADIYALGGTLFFALTGQPPFPGGTTREKMQRHRTEAPPVLQSLNPEVPPGFAALVGKMLAKKPEERFASARALREALLPWSGGSELAPPPNPQNESSEQDTLAVFRELDAPAELMDDIIVKAPHTGPGSSLRNWWQHMRDAVGETGHAHLWVGASLIIFWILVLVIGGIWLLR